MTPAEMKTINERIKAFNAKNQATKKANKKSPKMNDNEQGYKVGDILVVGLDFAKFYQVVDITKASIKIQAIKSNTEHKDFGFANVTPLKDQFEEYDYFNETDKPYITKKTNVKYMTIGNGYPLKKYNGQPVLKDLYFN